MKISVIDPISRSIDWVKHVLFEDFNLTKWFTIGFCAFLALLGENGGGGGANNISRGFKNSQDFSQLKNFILEHIIIISVGIAIFTLIIIGITILLKWLGCRGKFMFLDNVARNRAEVKAPWREFKTRANSLLLFEILLTLAFFAVFLIIVFIGLLMAWSDISAKTFGPNALIGIITALLLFIFIVIGFSVIRVLMKDFWVPIMYIRNVNILAAINIFNKEFSKGHFFDIFKYFLMKILLTFGIFIITVLCCCITCCIIAIPYIGTVILLPLIMFSRCYSLFFIEQFGDEWQIFEEQSEEVIIPEEETQNLV